MQPQPMRSTCAPGASRLPAAALALLLVVCLGYAAAARAQGRIFVCTDAHGNRISSDRVIVACLDRPQRELNASGVTIRTIEPSAPASVDDAAVKLREQEERARHQREQQQHAADALFARYPTRESHDQERQRALRRPQALLDLAREQRTHLLDQEAALRADLEHYASRGEQPPARLYAILQRTADAITVQDQAIAARERERRRVNADFDQQSILLEPLWPTVVAPESLEPTPLP